MNSILKIRKIEDIEKDIKRIGEISTISWQHAYKGIVDEKDLKNLDPKDKEKRVRKRYDISQYILVELNNEIVGFCNYCSDDTYESKYEEIDCEINALYLLPEVIQKGIGTQIFKYIINEMKNNKKKKMIIWCFKDNKSARKFYEKMGGKYFAEKDTEYQGKKYKGISYVYDIEEVYNELNKTKAYGEIKLEFPEEKHKKQIEEYLQEHFDNNEYDLSGDGGLDKLKDFDKWLEKIRKDLIEKDTRSERIPATLLLGIRKIDNKVVGTIQIRHKLNDKLLKYFGHIGYGIRPSERKKGYATEMTRLALEECKKLELNRVLITCDEKNIASSKCIIANGGVFENKVNYEDKEIVERYWISLKKKYAKEVKNKFKDVKELEQKIKTINEKDFKGDIYLNHFIKVDKPFEIYKGVYLYDNDYKWLEFYDYTSKFRLTAIYNEKNDIVEWYFDVARKIGKENGIPYEDDFYLDVVLRPNGETVLLDEDEFEEALKKHEMTKEEFEKTYEITNDLIKRLKGKEKEVKQFTDKYLKEIL